MKFNNGKWTDSFQFGGLVLDIDKIKSCWSEQQCYKFFFKEAHFCKRWSKFGWFIGRYVLKKFSNLSQKLKKNKHYKIHFSFKNALNSTLQNRTITSWLPNYFTLYFFQLIEYIFFFSYALSELKVRFFCVSNASYWQCVNIEKRAWQWLMAIIFFCFDKKWKYFFMTRKEPILVSSQITAVYCRPSIIFNCEILISVLFCFPYNFHRLFPRKFVSLDDDIAILT